MSTENDALSRYLVSRHGGWLGGGKNQMLVIKSQSIEICDASEREDSKEKYKLSDIVKIVPLKSKETLIQLIQLISL